MGWSVYKHTNLTNQKVYIGITSRKPSSRWGLQGKGYKDQPKFFNAIEKYGWENFKHEVLYTNLSLEEALSFESQLINEYNSIEKGYNVCFYGKIKTKKIICLTTRKIFNSLEEASNFANVSSSSLSHYLSGDYDTCGEFEGVKLEWEYLDCSEKNEEAKTKREIRKRKREEKFYSPTSLEIIKKYKDGVPINQLSKEYGKSKEAIKTLLNFYNIPIISSKERCSHGVYQLDDDNNIIKKYNSLTEASISIGIGENAIGRIKRACNEKWRKVKGFHWSWVDSQ